MIRQAGKLNIGDDVVRMQFLKSLPVNIRTPLATLTLQQLGDVANDILIMIQDTAVMAVPSPANPSSTPARATQSSATTHFSLTTFHQNQINKFAETISFMGHGQRAVTSRTNSLTRQDNNILPNFRPASQSSSPTPPENQ